MYPKKMTHKNELIIDLLRHGEPQGGQLIFRGRTDHPLTDLGWQQLYACVGDHHPWDAIISSPALRCAEFAQALASRLDLPLVQNEQLWELDLGAWEGKRISDVLANEPELLSRFWEDPDQVTPPDGEPLNDFQTRILEAWTEIQTAQQGKHLLIVSHSGTMRVIIGHILGMPLKSLLKLELPYAGLSRVRVFYDDQHAVTGSSLVFHAGSIT